MQLSNRQIKHYGDRRAGKYRNFNARDRRTGLRAKILCALALTIFVFGLDACGQKGPLVLPENSDRQQSEPDNNSN